MPTVGDKRPAARNNTPRFDASRGGEKSKVESKKSRPPTKFEGKEKSSSFEAKDSFTPRKPNLSKGSKGLGDTWSDSVKQVTRNTVTLASTEPQNMRVSTSQAALNKTAFAYSAAPAGQRPQVLASEVLANAKPGETIYVDGDLVLGPETKLDGVTIRVSGSIIAPEGATLEGINGASITAEGDISVGELIGGPGGLTVSTPGSVHVAGDFIGQITLEAGGTLEIGGMFVGGQKVVGNTIIGGGGGAVIDAKGGMHVYGGDFVGRNLLIDAQAAPNNTNGTYIAGDVTIHNGDFVGRDEIFTSGQEAAAAARIQSEEALLPQQDQIALSSLGLVPEDLVGLDDMVSVLPDLIAAGKEARAGNWDQAFDKLQQAGTHLPPELKEQVAQRVNLAARHLPEGHPLKPYLTDAAVARALLDSAPGVMKGLASGDPWTAVQAVAGNQALRDAVLDVAAKNPAFTGRLSQLGLTLDDVKAAGAALPQLIEGIRLWEAGEYEAAMKQLGEASATVAPAMAQVVSTLAEKLPGGPLKALLQDTQLVTALIQSGPDIVARLQRGEIASAMRDIASSPALNEALKHSQVVDGLLSEMGIPPELRGEALEIAPTLVSAATAAASQDWDTVVSQLQDSVDRAPGIVGHLGKLLASGIPGQGPMQDAARSLLSDTRLLQTLATDASLHQSLGHLLSGDPARMMSGLQGIASNTAVQGAAANALWSAMGSRLQELGIRSTGELQGLIGTVPDLLTALDHTRNGRWSEAVSALGAAVSKAPPGALANVLNTVAQKLDLPPGMEKLRGLFSSLGDILRTPGGGRAVGDLVDAFRTGDVNKLGSALTNLGTAITELNPTQQENLLNALGTSLPGKLGELFKDPELNKAMAHSGALARLFDAGERLLHGDFPGALTELGEAAVALLGGMPPSVDSLKSGLENFGRLFMRFFDTLPNAIRNRIEMAVMAATSNLFGNIPLIGDAIDSGKDLMALVDEMKQGDNLGVVLAGAQLAVDGAKWTQAGKVFTGPLEMALTVAQSADGAMDAFAEIKDQFGQIMMTGQDPTPRVGMGDRERELLQEVMIYGSDLGLTPGQAAAFVEANGDLKDQPAGVEAIFKAAKAAGVPPSQLPGFVNALRSELSGNFDDAMEMLGFMPAAVGNSSFLAHVMELPAVQRFFAGQRIDPVRELVEAVYQENLGRAPTARELAEGMARIRDNYEQDSYGNTYLELADAIQNSLELTQEWRDKHPHGKTVL
jgi:hypothetical protein